MRITCSRCGSSKEFRYTASNVNKTINDGWGSFGSVLYCPECVKTWSERNNKNLYSNDNTIAIIDDLRK